MPVAERLYYDDSFLRTFTAIVSDIREYARTDGQSQWQIALSRTAFYPTSGGQPFDRGALTALARSGAELVAEIDEVTEDDDGEVWHSTRKPLLPGTAVTGRIDWSRRLDHMQQHSGQHLLSAIFEQELGARTVSFHLGQELSSIDLAIDLAIEGAPRALPAYIPRVERMANEWIADDPALSVHTVSRTEAEALLADGSLRKLPPRSGAIRLLEIPGLELNACGGTHVRSLGQVGGLLLRGTERVKRQLRVEFVCGLRVAGAAREDFTALSSAAGTLSVARAAVPAAVERLLADTKMAVKAEQRWREEAAQQHAMRLAGEERVEQGVRLVVRTFPDRDGEYVRLLASRLVAATPQTCALLLSTSEEPATLVLASSPGLPCDCGERLRRALSAHGLRGGGSPQIAQTRVPKATAMLVAEAISKAAAEELRA
ncbi:MAG TPA: alanyl-tRNA editing protein [Acidobacteriaceae bacterium]